MSMRCVMAGVVAGIVGVCQSVSAQQLPGGIPSVNTITAGSLYHSHPSTYNSGNGVSFTQPSATANRGSAPLPKSAAGTQTPNNTTPSAASQTSTQPGQPAGNPLPLTAPLQQSLSTTGPQATPQASSFGTTAATPFGKPLQQSFGATGSQATTPPAFPTVPFPITPIALQPQKPVGAVGSQFVPLSTSPLSMPLNKPLSTPLQQSLTAATPTPAKPSSAPTAASSQSPSSPSPSPSSSSPSQPSAKP